MGIKLIKGRAITNIIELCKGTFTKSAPPIPEKTAVRSLHQRISYDGDIMKEEFVDSETGEYGRIDGPSVIYYNGRTAIKKQWYKDNELYREEEYPLST